MIPFEYIKSCRFVNNYENIFKDFHLSDRLSVTYFVELKCLLKKISHLNELHLDTIALEIIFGFALLVKNIGLWKIRLRALP